ncbi:hypothetical protein [Marinomonas transparens]|uniref:Uncharacterized protein n=1 Tax=Marinomonas transparens TaxID=2795388 RepID=A0A934JST1_9GAMM|nr:hypothetical protein [Marinomonas transparens]MBJ7539253.1 hypothetical protein [Marinomonas transparens]
MPLFLLPLLAGAGGFGLGWWSGSNYGWIMWLLIAVFAYFGFKKMGVI